MEHYVQDQVIIITGGSSGFGLEAARLLLELDARVVITGRNKRRLDAAAKELAHENLLAVVADANKTADWKRLIAATLKRFKRIDVLVNNTAPALRSPRSRRWKTRKSRPCWTRT